jgi:hypothetical protein
MNSFFFMGDLLTGLALFALSPSADARPAQILPARADPFGDSGGGWAAL